MATIALDTVTDDYSWQDGSEPRTAEQVLDDLVSGTNVTWEIEVEHGPAGGWPIVRYTAPTQEELDSFVFEHFGEE
jgi:hypothetical protein